MIIELFVTQNNDLIKYQLLNNCKRIYNLLKNVFIFGI